MWGILLYRRKEFLLYNIVEEKKGNYGLEKRVIGNIKRREREILYTESRKWEKCGSDSLNLCPCAEDK